MKNTKVARVTTCHKSGNHFGQPNRVFTIGIRMKDQEQESREDKRSMIEDQDQETIIFINEPGCTPSGWRPNRSTKGDHTSPGTRKIPAGQHIISLVNRSSGQSLLASSPHQENISESYRFGGQQ